MDKKIAWVTCIIVLIFLAGCAAEPSQPTPTPEPPTATATVQSSQTPIATVTETSTPEPTATATEDPIPAWYKAFPPNTEATIDANGNVNINEIGFLNTPDFKIDPKQYESVFNFPFAENFAKS
jgi:hypothetical protein